MPGKRPAPSADVVDHALRLAGEGWSGEEIDRALGFAAGEGRELTHVSGETIAEIVRELFGSGARIAGIERLGPLTTHGIQRRGGFTGNFVYAVAVDRRRLVLRFNRGLRDDVYDQERENYTLVEAATGVRGPAILHVDRSHRLVPSEYMVMERVEGELGSYLAHPANPDLSEAEKRHIRVRTGEFYAALHGETRPAGDAMHEMRRLLFGLYRLLDAAPSLGLDPAQVRDCIAAFEAAPALRSDTQTLCFMDGELLFAKREGGWEPAFVCDLEWAAWRGRNADLVPAQCWPEPLWSPAPQMPEATPDDPFFLAYGRRHSVDRQRLTEALPYYRLALWSHALADQRSPAHPAVRSGLLAALMRAV